MDKVTAAGAGDALAAAPLLAVREAVRDADCENVRVAVPVIVG